MSYNSLLTDPDLVARWNGDADGNGTGDANDAIGSNHLTWDSLESYSDPPAGKGSGKAFDVDQNVGLNLTSSIDFMDGDNAFTCWLKFTNSEDNFILATQSATDPRLQTRSAGLLTCGPAVGTGSPNFGSNAVFDGNWRCCVFNISGSTLQQITDGVQAGSAITTNSFTSIVFDRLFSRGNVPSQDLNGKAFDARHYTRHLTLAEGAELTAGPEPTYTSGATLAANGAYDVGTWDAQSNGTATYEWVVVEADGTVVDSGTGATGTADFGATTGLLTLLVRASNDGGYDVGDYATRTASYGSAGDGYYEVATVSLSSTSSGLSSDLARDLVSSF